MNNITLGDENIGYYETVAGGAGAVSVFIVYCCVCLFVCLFGGGKCSYLSKHLGTGSPNHNTLSRYL